MATKNTSTKKTPAKKKTSTKSVNHSTKKTTKSSKAHAAPRSFRLHRDREDFMTFRVNKETVYWAVLGAVVILFAGWIFQLQQDIQSLYDQIDASTSMTETLHTADAKLKK